jgi:hypothetical protein
MAAHRYWRIGFGNYVSADVFVAINELELRESIGGADVTGSGTASTKNVIYSTYVPSYAFDNNTAAANSTVFYYSATGNDLAPCYLDYDFGSGVTKDIVEIGYNVPVFGVGFSSTSSCPKGISLWYSDDGLNYTLKWALGRNDMPTWAENTAYSFTADEWDGTNSRGVNMRICTIKQVLDTYPTNVLTGYLGSNTAAPGLCRTIHRTRGWMPYRWLPNSGSGHIAGSTTSLGAPIPRTVFLIDQRSGGVLDRADTLFPDCTYQFDNLDVTRTYTVLGVDNTTIQNDVVYAHVTPVE